MQLPEGESIFISPADDGSRIDIKGDSLRRKERVEKSSEGRGGRVGSDRGAESRAKKRMRRTEKGIQRS